MIKFTAKKEDKDETYDLWIAPEHVQALWPTDWPNEVEILVWGKVFTVQGNAMSIAVMVDMELREEKRIVMRPGG